MSCFFASLQSDALAGADVPFLVNVHGELTSALLALEGPLRTLYLLLPMPKVCLVYISSLCDLCFLVCLCFSFTRTPRQELPEEPKSLTAELESDPEFKAMLGREAPPPTTGRPRNVTLHPIQAMLTEFDISAAAPAAAAGSEDVASPRGAAMSPRRDGSAAGATPSSPRDTKKEAELLIEEMMSSSLMPGLAKARPPALKPSPSSPAVLSGKSAAKPVAPLKVHTHTHIHPLSFFLIILLPFHSPLHGHYQ